MYLCVLKYRVLFGFFIFISSSSSFFFLNRQELAALKQGMRKEKQEFKFETTKAAREVEYLQDDVKERKMRMAMRALRRMEQYHIWRAFSVLKELVAYEHAHGDSVRICFIILFFLKLPLYIFGTPVASVCELTLSSFFFNFFVCPNHHIFFFYHFHNWKNT